MINPSEPLDNDKAQSYLYCKHVCGCVTAYQGLSPQTTKRETSDASN